MKPWEENWQTGAAPAAAPVSSLKPWEEDYSQTTEPMAAAKPEQSWGDVATSAIGNLPRSIGGVIGGVYDAMRHPIDTAGNLLDVAAGGLRNAMPASIVSALEANDPNAAAGADASRKADAVGQFYKQRYGSMAGVKNAIAEDPAAVLADASTVLTGGGALAARIPGGLLGTGKFASSLAREVLPGMAGRNIQIPEMLSAAGRAIDPLAASVRGVAAAVPVVGRGVANAIGGLGTHTGGGTIQEAARAGMAGGQRAADFADNMRGNVPMTDVLDSAKSALANMRAERGAAYRQGMQGVAADQTALNFAPIDKAMQNALEISNFKGKSINRSAGGVQEKIADIVSEWRNSDPAQFHTAEGFDALKQTIGDIRDSTEFGTPSRVVADRVYNAVKNQIINQAPKYANVMKDYEQASTLVKEIERSLSLGNKASADTAMRKLQSLTRNNVSTNYGNRVGLAKELEGAGASNLVSNLSGQALNSWTPRGLGNLIAGGAAAGGVMTANPLALPIVAAQSPRAMGELALATGRAAGGVSRTANQGLRLADLLGIDPATAGNLLYQSNEIANR